jgi:hypothetical protein
MQSWSLLVPSIDILAEKYETKIVNCEFYLITVQREAVPLADVWV